MKLLLYVNLSFLWAFDLGLVTSRVRPSFHIEEHWNSEMAVGAFLKGELDSAMHIHWQAQAEYAQMEAKREPLLVHQIVLQGGYNYHSQSYKWIPQFEGGMVLLFVRATKDNPEYLLSSNESEYGLYSGLSYSWSFSNTLALDVFSRWLVIWTLPERSHFMHHGIRLGWSLF